MAAPAQNQEIQLGFGERPQGNAAALFGPDIFVIGGDDKSDIQKSIYTAATGFSASSLGNKISWSNSRLALQDSFSTQTKCTCALAIQSLQSLPALYLFWAQPNAGVMATSATDVTQPSSGGTSTSPTVNWSAGLVLCDDNQAIMPAPDGACVSAVSLGSQAFLVAFPSGGNPFNLGAIGLYYVADQLPSTMTTTLAGTFGIWPARAMRAFSALELGALLPAVAGTGNSFGNICSIAVTPQVNGTSADGNNPLLLNLVMLLTLTMEDHSGKTPFQMAVTCPLDDTGSPLTVPFALAWSSTPTTKSPLTLLSDPAGRLVASGSSLEGGTKQEEDSLVFHLFNTYAQLQYLAQTTQSAQSSNTSTPATSLFIVDTSNPTTTTSKNVTQNGTMTSTSYPLLQLVFYGGTTVAQSITYGSAVSMANYSNFALTTQDGGATVVVTGIIDGPLPMPAANVIGWQFEGTSNDLVRNQIDRAKRYAANRQYRREPDERGPGGHLGRGRIPRRRRNCGRRVGLRTQLERSSDLGLIEHLDRCRRGPAELDGERCEGRRRTGEGREGHRRAARDATDRAGCRPSRNILECGIVGLDHEYQVPRCARPDHLGRFAECRILCTASADLRLEHATDRHIDAELLHPVHGDAR